MPEMTGSVLDILIYVFDRYMLADTPDVPERDELALDLERAGFAEDCVERALDWLADLAGERDRPALEGAGTRAMRIFTDSERVRLPADCRGYLLSLERAGILSPQQREIVIERLLALDGPGSYGSSAYGSSAYGAPGYNSLEYNSLDYNEELDVSQLKWVVLMVLSSQPGEELACSRMEDLVFDLMERPH